MDSIYIYEFTFSHLINRVIVGIHELDPSLKISLELHSQITLLPSFTILWNQSSVTIDLNLTIISPL